ncbi:MAG: tetratricopeptide repeat protein [Thermodesulfobacteriota bacterium]|nr:tetratricopeptide repeat protein [Thermodesulfobacteriota bacterium]
MAKKDKILAAAQKYLQKNNLARAIKEYLKVVEMDAKDVRSRKKLAELYSRTGNIEDALTHYAIVATYYADNTFFLKAIAVYKLMQKLAPEHLAYTLKLAQLNEQQGLVGNALSEYRTLLLGYEASEKNEDVAKTLNRMRELDPENISIGVRMAEFYARVGDKGAAQKEFIAVEQKLSQLGNYKQLQKLYEHFMAVWPDDVATKMGYGRVMIDYGEPLGGVQYLIKLQRQYPKESQVLFMLSRGFRKCSEFKRELECLERLIGWEAENLEYQRAIYRAALDADEPAKAFEYLEKGKESFFAAEQVADLKPFYESVRDLLPEKREVLTSLHDIYEQLGEGEKLFDVLSSDLGGETESSGTSFDVDTFDVAGGSDSNADDIAFEELEFDTEAQTTVNDSSDDISFDDISFDIVSDDSLAVDNDAFDLNDNNTTSASVDISTDLEEADFYLQQGLIEEAQQVCDRLKETNPEHAGVLALLKQIEQRNKEEGSSSSTMDTAADIATSVEFDDGGSTQGMTLDLDLSGRDSSMNESGSADNFDFLGSDGDIDSNFADLHIDGHGETGHGLADSQRGVVTVITDDDTESAYNLGIAYKEMGLIDDAIAEFDKAMKSPARKLDSLSLKAACYIVQQKFDAAEEVLTIGLSDSLLSSQDQIYLYYETGLLYEVWDRPADALSSYQVVADSDSNFRDINVKIAELKELVGDGGAVEANRVSYL